MRLIFEGIDIPIDITNKAISILQIEQPVLFSRVCKSLVSGKGREAIEAYSVWDEKGEEIKSSDSFLVVVNPFDLPWKAHQLGGRLYERLRLLMLEDEDARSRINELGSAMNSAIAALGFLLRSDLEFGLEWDLCGYLKSQSFNVVLSDDASLFDNLIKFLDLAADMQLKSAIVFVNLKIFLSENEISELYSHIIFLGIQSLFLEGTSDDRFFNREQKIVIEQDFLEYCFMSQSDDLSPSQGRICSNGFGAVTI